MNVWGLIVINFVVCFVGFGLIFLKVYIVQGEHLHLFNRSILHFVKQLELRLVPGDHQQLLPENHDVLSDVAAAED